MPKMRMGFYIIGTKPYYKEVPSVEVAKTIADAIADFVNAKVEEGAFPDHCSTVDLEVYSEEEKEWVPWFDENGLDFEYYLGLGSEEVEPETSQRKAGYWIVRDGKERGFDIGGVKTWYIQIMCSKCGFIKVAIEGRTGLYKFCPNCGQPKMQEVKEGK